MELSKNMILLGNYFFKYRGQFPILVFLIAFPIMIYTSHYYTIDVEIIQIIRNSAILIGLSGLLLRYYTIGTTPHGTSGKNRNQQIANTLNTKGIYSIVRNPLYLANYLIWLGASMYSVSYILIIIITLIFIVYYERIIISEEKFLIEKFKQNYVNFCKNTPAIIPNFKNYKNSDYQFSIKKVLKEEYSSTLSTVITFLYVELIINTFILHKSNVLIQLPEKINTYILILVTSVIITLLLKIMKQTKMLKDKN